MTDLHQPQTVTSNYNYGTKPKPVGKISYEDFLEWADEDTYAEWVDGEIIMTSPASYQHQDVAHFLTAILKIFVAIYDMGKVVQAPFQMKLPDRPGREPDLFFVAKARLGQMHRSYFNGAADLAMEIVSPESVARDTVDKLAEYESAGVREYWLINPLTEEATFYYLDETGHYQVGQVDSDGKYFSQVLPGFWLKAEWLWRNPLPSVHNVLIVVAGNDYREYNARTERDEQL